ncbi:hypothetical protein EUX98_g6808 [Antrodiella citrinella]|uniref:DUF6534 domain-containing protein n=1 Tax=Antrodiella citrinella TaxID=2447956 RepID=A0A4S4MNW1_9APHY|nr:hypothetical protein EUX98_g6808 [Antrodiella citrinella]
MAAEPTIQEVLGGYVVEAFVAILLYGIFIAQTYVYAMNCNKDALYLKLCVACIAVIETAHSIFVVHVAYTYAINSFGNLAGVVDHVIWSVGASVICEQEYMQLIIVVIVQSLYIRRIYIRELPSLLALTSLIDSLIIYTDADNLIKSLLLFLRLAFGFASVALLYTLNTWSGFRFGKAFFTVTTALSLSSLVDLLFALTLTYYLRRAKTGFKKTDNMVHVLMAYSVNTGLLTM